MDESFRHEPPGTRRSRRFLPPFHYELIGCGLGGHELLGTDAAEIRPTDPTDALLVREDGDGLRWCDAWIPLRPPAAPSRQHLPSRDEIVLPMRGRPLRDRYVLRLIALDRLVHFVVLGALALLVFVFAGHRDALSPTFYRIIDAVQGTVGSLNGRGVGGIIDELTAAFTAKSSTLLLVGGVLAAYALLEGVEAVGLWWGRRWAEYLTLVATAALMIPEVYELTGTVTPTKVIALIINVAVVIYLLVAKRLFGLRGAAAEAAERERDTGWSPLERMLPGPTIHPAPDGPVRSVTPA